MKRYTACIISAALLMLSGCGISKDAAPDHVFGNIHILYDREAVTWPEEAAAYGAIYRQFDAKALQNRLLRYKVASAEENALGRAFYTRDPESDVREYLIIYDIGAEAGVYGGFTYNVSTGLNANYQEIVQMHPGHPDMTLQTTEDNDSEDFPVWTDLDFMPVGEAVRVLKDTASDCGLSEIREEEVYSLTADILQKRGSLIDTPEEPWETPEEAYLLHFSQIVDEIPIADHIWCTDIDSRNAGTMETTVTALISGEGLLSFRAKGVVNVTEEKSRGKLLSAEEAEARFLKEYDDGTRLSDIYAEALSLEYIIRHDGDSLLLTPAWIFCISKDAAATHPATGEDLSFKEYEHYVIDAITGEQIETGVVQK